MPISQKQTDFIKSYFKMLKIRNAKDNKQFWDKLFQKYEKNTVNTLLKIFVERPEKSITESYMPEVYNTKNQNLELSIDFSRMTCDLHTQYLKWFIGALKTTPTRILDIGCDNGIVTCFYAMLFPESEIVGIDPCENGITCAVQLAEKLKLSNVTFKKTAIEQCSNIYPEGYFDVVTAVTTLKEITGSLICEILAHPGDYDIWCLEDLPITVGSHNLHESLVSIKKLLADNGKYISFERWFAEDCIWWSEKLKNAGLYIDWEESKTLHFQEVGQDRIFPALVIDKTIRQYNSIDSTANLWLRGEDMDPKNQSEREGLSAEIMFRRIVDRDFISGVQCNYTKSSLKIRYEAWKNSKMMLFYQSSNTGYRQLKITPVHSDESLRKILVNLKQHHFQNGYKTFYYENLCDVEKFND